MFRQVSLPLSLVETLKSIYIQAKIDYPELTESLFLEILMRQWLEQFRINRKIKDALPTTKEDVVLKNNLKEAIKQSGKTQKQVAKEVGITPTYLSQVIKGRYEPGIGTVLLLAAALDYPVTKIHELFYLVPKGEIKS